MFSIPVYKSPLQKLSVDVQLVVLWCIADLEQKIINASHDVIRAKTTSMTSQVDLRKLV